MTYVHLAKGHRYHADRDCDALIRGQALWGQFAPELQGAWLTMSETVARERGTTPCGVCLPGHPLPPVPGLFGHQPYEYDGVLICRRCHITHNGRILPVYWPCRTAGVLGLPE